ncbi:MAG TPA: HIT domain-containing protein [Caldisericia bacterium]|nr:HIT domain-containing protein [Caldisericia bacterium]HPF48123.1 HIT domain-containing protein [Caldisericia bacterium]HPI83940.1 HIT domain-containing protein [Caldisericia bacterium]HPQ92576.1 HIT domain-containing protein [Caldisericia bacterium]HRV74326.1 HIT domain-containing protein [Caldisericia bacterium]
MRNIYASWRLEFIKGKNPEGCVFCEAIGSSDDREYGVVKRSSHCVVMLNKYPYTTGHVMVIPNRHVGDFTQLSVDELHDLANLTQEYVTVLRKAFEPEAFNIGMNLGRFAGAGICDHIHTHIVPRWAGDNNFMPVVGGTRIHPMDLETVFKLIEKFSV